MSLPSPQLDDRTWDDLVDEAKRRISAKCPAWTDFNPSDPGMALVELMAWMTETTLYRLNRVPDKNYIKFLELIGLKIRTAQPARTWAFFTVVQKVGEEEKPIGKIPVDTEISTQPKGDGDPVTFATKRELHLTASRIVQTASRYGVPPNQSVTIHNLSGERPWEEEIFALPKADSSAARAVPHILYLGDTFFQDPLFQKLRAETALHVLCELEQPMAGSLFLEWEAWDGQCWQTVLPDEDTTAGLRNDGRISFQQLPATKGRGLDEVTRGQISGTQPAAGTGALPSWLRARLVGSIVEQLPKFRSIRRQIDLKACAIAPLVGLVETQPGQFLPLEINADFYPFGPKLVQGSSLWIASDLFGKAGAIVSIQLGLKKPLQPQAGDRVEIHWEYKSTHGQWRALGRSTPAGVTSDCELQDGTQAFTRSGIVSFRCPEDIAVATLGGHPGRFVRARAEFAAFTHERDAQVVADSVALGFSQEIRPWLHCLSENYSRFEAHPATGGFEPFKIEEPQDPAFYLCLDKRPPIDGGPYRLFLDIAPQIRALRVPGTVQDKAQGLRWLRRPAEFVIAPRGAQLTWEYRTAAGWKPLPLGVDGTDDLAHEGTVEFFSRPDWKELNEFETVGYWLRVRWEIAEFKTPPRLRRVALNAVEIEQSQRHTEVLGSSSGEPNQTFSHRTTILEEPEIWVRESNVCSDEELARIQEQLTAEKGSDGKPAEKLKDGCWVRWTQVTSFLVSTDRDRHFVADLDEGTFRFGDGRKGMIPPKGAQNIEAWSRVTLGARGNVGSRTITVLESPSEPVESLKSVQSVTNYYPAEGGCDSESIEQLRQRGPWELKHGDRAVTREDFIMLAKKASPLVGNAACFDVDGVIHVAIVADDESERPQPSQVLIQDVREYLNARRLINTRIKVVGLQYQPVDAEIVVVLKPLFRSRFAEVKKAIEKKLRRYVHPLVGTDQETGWPMGRSLHRSELYYLVERVEGVDHVAQLKICLTGTGRWEDRIKFEDQVHPCFGAALAIGQTFE